MQTCDATEKHGWEICLVPLEAGFLLVTDSQYDQGIAIDAIPGDIAAFTEFNQQFPVFLGQIVYRTTDVWQFSEFLDTLDDGVSSTLGR